MIIDYKRMKKYINYLNLEDKNQVILIIQTNIFILDRITLMIDKIRTADNRLFQVELCTSSREFHTDKR